MKAKTIRIKSIDESLNDFKKTFKKAEKNKHAKATPTTYFSSFEAARKIMTQERIKLLRAIKFHKPGSIYELAKILNKNIKNVSQDVHFLSEIGLVDLKESHQLKKQKKPSLITDHLVVDLVI